MSSIIRYWLYSLGTGVAQNAKGELVLTANLPSTNTSIAKQYPRQCQIKTK
ncbi:MAG: hypothetical protein HC908_09725 [Calothrix sp. SM1_7_51]|nr:hypothetical protein [Calothrix sp. SM1_7_51]